MGSKNFKSHFKRAPNFSFLGFQGRKQHLQRSDAPTIHPQDDLPIELSQVHQRATLMQGELMLKDALRAGRSKVYIFVDNSISCTHFFSKEEQFNKMISNLCAWLSHHHWEWELFKSTHRAWNNELWNTWYKELSRQQDSIAIVLSDFHGEFPTGLFWKQLQSLPDSRILWWQHPPSQTGDKDIEDLPDQQRQSSNHFLDLQQSWNHKLTQTLSLMGLNFHKVKSGTGSEIEQQVADYLT